MTHCPHSNNSICAACSNYNPGEIVDCGGWKWQCYCDDGPPDDWENSDMKMVMCMGCEEIYGHVDFYGFQDIYDNNKEAWNNCVFLSSPETSFLILCKTYRNHTYNSR